ncbi:MAG: hypothetical protein JW820_09260 [Spirochaetales bacterium]|nr:hypothetical protein [Spirochaetales bacterium]
MKKTAIPPELRAVLREGEAERVRDLESPDRVQSFLDTLDYSHDPIYRCPARVLRDRRAHCVDGALLAAALLRAHGRPPLICMLVPNQRDDVHYLALFREGRRWGAVSKSNFAGLRYREPVFRSLRELALSYFEQYYNVEREKTLRGYTVPLDLRRLDSLRWMSSDDRLEELVERVDRLPWRRLLTEAAAAKLRPVDERTYRAGLLGADEQGLFRPEAAGSGAAAGPPEASTPGG